VAFVAGTATALWTESELRRLIQYLFRVLTGERITFYGKNFHLLSPIFYYLTFGFLIAALVLTKLSMSRKQALKLVAIDMITFSLTMVAMCLIISNKLVVECTACEDGVRKINYNDIDYVLIILTSLAATLLSFGLNQIKRITRAARP
jgi:hypothetical protein